MHRLVRVPRLILRANGFSRGCLVPSSAPFFFDSQSCGSTSSTAANWIPHLGICWQLLLLLCQFETGQQLHITWCATGCDKAIALASLCCAVLTPVFLEFAARVLLVSLA